MHLFCLCASKGFGKYMLIFCLSQECFIPLTSVSGWLTAFWLLIWLLWSGHGISTSTQHWWMNEWANEWIMQIAKHQVGYAHGENITFIFPRAHTHAWRRRRYRHWRPVSLSLSITHLLVGSFVLSCAPSFIFRFSFYARIFSHTIRILRLLRQNKNRPWI